MTDNQMRLQEAYNALCGALGSLKLITEPFGDDLANIAADIELARKELAPIAFPHMHCFDGASDGG